MYSLLSNDQQLIVGFAEGSDIAFEGTFEHAHGRRHQALGKIRQVDSVAIDEILELVLAFQLILQVLPLLLGVPDRVFDYLEISLPDDKQFVLLVLFAGERQADIAFIKLDGIFEEPVIVSPIVHKKLVLIIFSLDLDE